MRLPGVEAAVPAQQVCVKVDEIIVILRYSDQPLARCILKVLGN
jgi:hypothetical protein